MRLRTTNDETIRQIVLATSVIPEPGKFVTLSSEEAVKIFIFPDCRHDLKDLAYLKKTAFSLASAVMNNDSNKDVVSISFLLDGVGMDLYRGRDISVRRLDIAKLSENSADLSSLEIKPDIQKLESALSSLLPQVLR